MYVKLALRNAKRSIADYLLYMITTVILCSFMFISNYVAIIANVEVGFQTISLPLLIAIILFILVSYINKFMLRQRSKEFANYMLLGMEKKKLVNMFLCEFWVIECCCFLVCCIICLGVCLLISDVFQLIGSEGFQGFLYVQCLKDTILYVCIIMLVSMYGIKKRISKLEITELMVQAKCNYYSKGENQSYTWGIIFLINFLMLMGMLCGIRYLSGTMIMILVSLICIPLVLSIVAFYKWFYYYSALIRQKQPTYLYRKERFYLIANITSKANTNATMNSIFCLCLFFSSMSFLFGTFMLQAKNIFFDERQQAWMGFLQICLCIIFIVLYFSILSLQQIIDVQQQKKEFTILHYLGKTPKQIKGIVKKQLILNLLFPTMMCFVLLMLGLPFLNTKLNQILSKDLHDFMLTSIAVFFLCFLVLYGLYYFMLSLISQKIIHGAIDVNDRGIL